MKMRRIFAAALAATTLLGTALPTMADTTTSYPNLTAYQTPYTTTVDNEDGAVNVTLMACGAAADWSAGFLSQEEVSAVQWKVISGSTSGVSIAKTASKEINEGQYVATAIVKVSEEATNGIAVVEAFKANGAYTDFTISVKNDGSAVQTVTGVNNVFYNTTSGEDVVIGTVNDISVNVNNHYGNSNYASVLDVPMATLLATDSIVGNYKITSSYGTYMIQSFTLKGKEYSSDPSDYTAPGWQYRVYDTNGKLVELSEKVSADDCPLTNGCTIVWKYGTYAGTTFADTL